MDEVLGSGRADSQRSMKTDRNTALADLWLHTATANLCDKAKERIATEIKAHYADLVEARVAEGMPLTDARLKALEDLGDAKVAARRFRKQHLTKNDERKLSWILQINRGPIIVLSLLVFSLFTFFNSLLAHLRFKMPLNFATIAVFLILPAFVCKKAWQGRDGSWLSGALLWDMAFKVTVGLFGSVYILMVQLLAINTGHTFTTYFMIISPPLFQGCSLGFAALDSYRLRRKLVRQQKWGRKTSQTG